jgi:hypothetical protein
VTFELGVDVYQPEPMGVDSLNCGADDLVELIGEVTNDGLLGAVQRYWQRLPHEARGVARIDGDWVVPNKYEGVRCVPEHLPVESFEAVRSNTVR